MRYIRESHRVRLLVGYLVAAETAYESSSITLRMKGRFPYGLWPVGIWLVVDGVASSPGLFVFSSTSLESEASVWH